MKDRSRFLPDPAKLFFLALVFAVPLGLAVGVAGASWLEAGIAFLGFYLALFLVLGHGRIAKDVFGFTLIFGTATGWRGVPLLALVLRLSGIFS